MRALIRSGDVSASHVVCREGATTWTPVDRVHELAALLPASDRSDTSIARQSDGQALSPPTDDRTSGPYLMRHWRGDLPLSASYWANGTLLSAIVAVAAAAFGFADFASAPRLWSLLCIAMWTLVLAMSVWQIVGVWRAAGRHVWRGGSRRWAVAARVAIVVGVVQMCAIVATQAVPQVREFTNLLLGRDDVGGYEIRILRDGSELELAGYIAFGLTDRIAASLDAHPRVTVIHLNSGGGRVAEARRLRDLIVSRHLSTYTSTRCASACVIPFLAGWRRLIAPDAKVGFHQYTFAGRATAQTVADMETEKKYFASRGVSSAFIARAFEPTSDLWFPTPQQMLAARFITGYARGDEVALSGMAPSDLDDVDRTLRQDPLYAAMADYEPEAYQRIAAAVKEGFRLGHTLAELRTTMRPVVQEVYRKRLPFASDEAVVAFARLMVDQLAVLRADPAQCMAYLFPKSDGNLHVAVVLGHDLVEREQRAMAEVIRTAVTGTSRPPRDDQVEPIRAEIVGRLRATWPAEDLDLLAHLDRPGVDPSRACSVCYGFYRAVVDLPTDKAGDMLRFTFSAR